MSHDPRLTHDPHAGARLWTSGLPLAKAQAAMVLVHGRGASAPGILSLTKEFEKSGFAFLAPQANQNTWYPHRFNAPTADNEPWLSSALQLVESTVRQIEQSGIAEEKIILLGFSQGACLVLEYAARYARRFGGVVGLSGGLIGADNEPRQDRGSLAGTPVFLGCSTNDFHIPEDRVRQTATILAQRGAQVETRFYPDLGHTINQDEITWIQRLMAQLTTPSI